MKKKTPYPHLYRSDLKFQVPGDGHHRFRHSRAGGNPDDRNPELSNQTGIKNRLFKGRGSDLFQEYKAGLFLICIFTAATAKSDGADFLPVPVRKAESAVFHIKHTPYHHPHPSDGTGFVIEISGRPYFVTNLRSGKGLAQVEGEYRVTNKKGLSLKQGDIKAVSLMHGLVVAELKKYKGASLRPADRAAVDSSFFIMGFPGGNFTVRRARWGRDLGNGRVLGVRDIPLRTGGSKGGPVLNHKGEVMGAVSPARNYQALFVQSRIIQNLIRNGTEKSGNGNENRNGNENGNESGSKNGGGNRNGNENGKVREDILSAFEAAERGSAEAQYMMAYNLHTAYQNTRDLEFSREAVDWYTKSAGQGHFLSRLALGLMYLTGEGVLRDVSKSEGWLRRAVRQQKSPLADFYLSLALLAKGDPEGAKLMEKSASGGLRPARDFMNEAGSLNGHDISMWLKRLTIGGCDRILFQL